MEEAELIEAIQRMAERARDTEAFLWQIVDRVPAALGFYMLRLWLLDEPGAWLCLQAGSGEIGKIMTKMNHRLGRMAQGRLETILLLRVGRSGQAGVMDESEIEASWQERGLSAIHRPSPLLPDVKSCFATPLHRDGQLVGVLEALSDEPTFDRAFISPLQGIAEVIAPRVDRVPARGL